MLHKGVAARVTPRLDRVVSRVSTNVPLLEGILGRVDATLSLYAVRARVVRIVDETPDTKTYWLKPNARFATFRPGSYVSLRVRIEGQLHERSYSLSDAPRADSLISITVTRVAEGRVSNWLADSLRPGHVVELSQATGQFVLPRVLPPKLLMLSGGSGITPVMSMLRQLIAERAGGEIVFVHFARSPRHIIFRDELRRIARSHDRVRIVCCVEQAGPEWQGARGRVTEQLLRETAGDFASLDTFMCGPAGFMQAVTQILARSGSDLSRLRYERFNATFDASQFLAGARVLRFVRSGTERITTQPRTILEEAERAGVPVASGCRAGNCGTCRCKKTRGVVVDITTGRESTEGESFIYPCVSVARGTVEIDL